MTTESTASDLADFEAEATGQTVEKVTPTTIPDKFKGKSVEDMIQSYQNLEKLQSRQASELGQVRRMADQLLELKKPTTETKQHVERQPVTVETLLNDPEKALNSAVNSSDLALRAQRAEEGVARLERKLGEQEFVTKHSDYAKDITDPDFIAWTQKNEVRRTLGEAAAQNNFVAAKNLWDMWEEHKELTAAKTTTADTTKAKAKVTATVRTAPNEVVNAGKPILSRSKLMELRTKVEQGDQAAQARWKDPEFQRRMIEAYAEDRVR